MSNYFDAQVQRNLLGIRLEKKKEFWMEWRFTMQIYLRILKKATHTYKQQFYIIK